MSNTNDSKLTSLGATIYWKFVMPPLGIIVDIIILDPLPNIVPKNVIEFTGLNLHEDQIP
jgi:hypothetical protein